MIPAVPADYSKEGIVKKASQINRRRYKGRNNHENESDMKSEYAFRLRLIRRRIGSKGSSGPELGDARFRAAIHFQFRAGVLKGTVAFYS